LRAVIVISQHLDEGLVHKMIGVFLLCLAARAAGSGANKNVVKPISPYMQQTGILYLENVDGLTLRCGQTSTADSDCLASWESLMDGLEDRMTITLGDRHAKRPSGDIPYLDLLKIVKYVRRVLVTRDGNGNDKEAWGKAYVKCAAYAHTVALEGTMFDGDGGCEAAIDVAVNSSQ
jgi:hypothetical protein